MVLVGELSEGEHTYQVYWEINMEVGGTVIEDDESMLHL